MNSEVIFNKIKDVINLRKVLNNPFDETYIRRLEYYPEFLQMHIG